MFGDNPRDWRNALRKISVNILRTFPGKLRIIEISTNHTGDKTMVNQTERKYVSDAEAYNKFVGNITPYEFVEGFEEFDCPVDEAVKDFLRNFPYDEPIPAWLEDALYRYVESKLEDC
jgi:hypothetical protein